LRLWPYAPIQMTPDSSYLLWDLCPSVSLLRDLPDYFLRF
jgi:hypothetical protein